ncbi:GDNF-inducible zinc finger protein 1-like [Folsomia candida]|uniref:GDNF-inducible zinc finger protein 1-like n=1 Tax=Folsomia candida TaxID=158441 RepID=UPI000B8FBF86|nr:GDNF-inducible zinc finger protein 1-like [Folsomia candida]
MFNPCITSDNLSPGNPRIHSTREQPSCDTCHGVFSKLVGLRLDVKAVHSTPKGSMKIHEVTHLQKTTPDTLQCHVCPQAFLSRSALQRHIRVLHENRRNYPCTFCKRRFSISSNLKRHVAMKHAASKEKIHSCDKCEYKSHSKFNLKQRHNATKRHECYFCKKLFASFPALVRHCSRVHTLEK